MLEGYIPGRPSSFALGVNLRTSTRLAAINLNGQAERIGWSATTQDAAITDNQKLGIGIEALFPPHNDNNLALRPGSSRAASVATTSALHILAAGIGYGFKRHHAVDLAWERR